MGIHKRGAVHSTTKWCWFLESEVQQTNDINLVASKAVRTRVCCPPRAFSVRSTSCTVLTQHLTTRRSHLAGILVPFQCRQERAAD